MPSEMGKKLRRHVTVLRLALKSPPVSTETVNAAIKALQHAIDWTDMCELSNREMKLQITELRRRIKNGDRVRPPVGKTHARETTDDGR